MIDPAVATRWGHRAGFAAIAAAVVFVQLLPFRIGWGALPGPEIVSLLALAWVARRPDYVPAPLIAAVALMADILTMRPPGLWAALTVLGTEWLRGRGATTRELPFAVEWFLVAVIFTTMTVAAMAVGAVMLPSGPTPAGYLAQAAVSVTSYPAVVLLSVLVFGVRRPLPGGIDPMRARRGRIGGSAGI